MDLTTSFSYSDEFCKPFEKSLDTSSLSAGTHQRNRSLCLSLSEVVTLLVHYHQSGFKTFKDYYLRCSYLKPAFPSMPSYNRFIELQQKSSSRAFRTR